MYWIKSYKAGKSFRNGRQGPTWESIWDHLQIILTVSLILNSWTGHTSPQYHVKHDKFLDNSSRKNHQFLLPRTRMEVPRSPHCEEDETNRNGCDAGSEGAMQPSSDNVSDSL